MSETTIHFHDKSARVIIHDPNEHIQRHWAKGRFYETGRNGLLTYMAAHYERGLTYVDVGASIGNHTLFFLSVLEAKQVIAIEPYPTSVNHLSENVSINSLHKFVDLLPFAASNAYTWLKMRRYDTTDHLNVGMVKIDLYGTDIHSKTLDQMIGGRHVDVIKIDVEHYNIPVLEGARETLARGPDIYIECENDHERDETDAFMREVGYVRTEHVFNSTPTYEYIHE